MCCVRHSKRDIWMPGVGRRLHIYAWPYCRWGWSLSTPFNYNRSLNYLPRNWFGREEAQVKLLGFFGPATSASSLWVHPVCDATGSEHRNYIDDPIHVWAPFIYSRRRNVNREEKLFVGLAVLNWCGPGVYPSGIALHTCSIYVKCIFSIFYRRFTFPSGHLVLVHSPLVCPLSRERANVVSPDSASWCRIDFTWLTCLTFSTSCKRKIWIISWKWYLKHV